MRTSICVCALVATCTALLLASASARDFEDEKTGLVVWLPDDWKTHIDKKNPDVLLAESPDDSLNACLVAIDGAANLEAAVGRIDEELAKVINDMKVDNERDEKTVNGLPVVIVHGTGTYEDDDEDTTETVHFSGAIVSNGDKFLVILTFGKDEALKQHMKITNRIVESVRKKQGEKKKDEGEKKGDPKKR